MKESKYFTSQNAEHGFMHILSVLLFVFFLVAPTLFLLVLNLLTLSIILTYVNREKLKSLYTTKTHT